MSIATHWIQPQLGVLLGFKKTIISLIGIVTAFVIVTSALFSLVFSRTKSMSFLDDWEL